MNNANRTLLSEDLDQNCETLMLQLVLKKTRQRSLATGKFYNWAIRKWNWFFLWLNYRLPLCWSIFCFSPGALKLISANLNSHLSSSSVLSTRGECYQKMLPSNRARKFHNSESSTNVHWGLGRCVCVIVWRQNPLQKLFINSISDTYYSILWSNIYERMKIHKTI